MRNSDRWLYELCKVRSTEQEERAKRERITNIQMELMEAIESIPEALNIEWNRYKSMNDVVRVREAIALSCGINPNCLLKVDSKHPEYPYRIGIIYLDRKAIEESSTGKVKNALIEFLNRCERIKSDPFFRTNCQIEEYDNDPLEAKVKIAEFIAKASKLGNWQVPKELKYLISTPMEMPFSMDAQRDISNAENEAHGSFFGKGLEEPMSDMELRYKVIIEAIKECAQDYKEGDKLDIDPYAFWLKCREKDDSRRLFPKQKPDNNGQYQTVKKTYTAIRKMAKERGDPGPYFKKGR